MVYSAANKPSPYNTSFFGGEGGWRKMCDLSHQLFCIALLPLTLSIKDQSLNCVAYINSEVIPVYTSPRCDSVDLLSILRVFTASTGVHLVHGFLTRIVFKCRDIESFQGLNIKVNIAHLRKPEFIVRNKCTLRKALYMVDSRLQTIISDCPHIWKISTFTTTELY